MYYFSCSGGPDPFSIKCKLGHVTPNLCFASGGIRSHSAFRCDGGMKRRRTIFHARVGLVQFP
jgi:hypothetical protein